MRKYLLLLAIFFTASHLSAQSEVANSDSASGKARVADIYSMLEQQTDGGNLTCSYQRNDASESGDHDVLLECTAHNADRQKAGDTQLCIVQKIQCFSQTTGHFEMENVRFYGQNGKKCSEINPTEAFTEHLHDWFQNVNFIGNH